MNHEIFDTVIIGAGPAGLTAAIYLGRAGLKTIVFGDSTKSGMYSSPHIQNYPGFPKGIDGKALSKNFLDQVRVFNAPVKNLEVVGLRQKATTFETKTADGTRWHSKTVLIASGRTYVPSGILKEKVWLGRGISTCVTCDGYFFKDKNVAVLGNSSFSAEEAIELLSYTKNITILTNGRDPFWNQVYQPEIDKNSLKIVKDPLKSFAGAEKFKGIVTREDKLLEFDGVFIANGAASSLNFAQGLGLAMDNSQYITIDREGKTNIEGVFAAGYCTSLTNQVTKSVGEGSTAAISLIKQLKVLDAYVDHT